MPNVIFGNKVDVIVLQDYKPKHIQPHIKLYFDYFGYDFSSWIACEVCGKTATDIHHIKARGMGGTKKKDTIENLMALCRDCHVKFGDKVEYYDFLNHIHKSKL